MTASSCRGSVGRLGAAFALAAALFGSTAANAVVGANGDAAAFKDRVVMVLSRSAEGAAFCSGVVLAPRVVLTAAHCLREPGNMLVHYRDAGGAPVVYEVVAAIRHPDYHPDAIARRLRSIDVGVLETKSALPAPFRPAEIASGAAPAPGAEVIAAGFGVSEEGRPKTGGQLRSALLRVREPRSKILLWAEPLEKAASGACSGDSGAPIFDATGQDVVAIVAWTAGEGRAKCGRLTQGAFIGPIRQWIDATIANLPL
jgi:hypothetical protein